MATMSHLTDRAEVHAYFASMNPLASKIMDTMTSVKDMNASAWEEMKPESRDALCEAALIPGNTNALTMPSMFFGVVPIRIRKKTGQTIDIRFREASLLVSLGRGG